MKEKLKLNKLSMEELEKQEMNSLKGGIGVSTMSTGGAYVTSSYGTPTTTTPGTTPPTSGY